MRTPAIASGTEIRLRRCGFCGTTCETDVAASGDCCRQSTRTEPLALSVDHKALYSISEWFDACPPKGGKDQWRDGYSAKESAKAWFRHRQVGLPLELASLLESCPELSGFRLGTVTPEVCTKLDDFRQGRNADAIVMGVANGRRTLIAVEAKAAEDFGQQIGARLGRAISKTKVPNRINALSESVFGRPVTIMDPALAGLRYQLLHAVAGALIEGKARGAEQVLFAVHYFPNKRRPMEETFGDFSKFMETLRPGAPVTVGTAVRFSIPGSKHIPADLPFYAGWATAPTDGGPDGVDVGRRDVGDH